MSQFFFKILKIFALMSSCRDDSCPKKLRLACKNVPETAVVTKLLLLSTGRKAETFEDTVPAISWTTICF